MHNDKTHFSYHRPIDDFSPEESAYLSMEARQLVTQLQERYKNKGANFLYLVGAQLLENAKANLPKPKATTTNE